MSTAAEQNTPGAGNDLVSTFMSQSFLIPRDTHDILASIGAPDRTRRLIALIVTYFSGDQFDSWHRNVSEVRRNSRKNWLTWKTSVREKPHEQSDRIFHAGMPELGPGA